MGVISIEPHRLIKPVRERNNEVVGAWLALPDRGGDRGVLLYPGMRCFA
jgi:hypothetical protein